MHSLTNDQMQQKLHGASKCANKHPLPFFVAPSTLGGLGVFASRTIAAGELILQFKGEKLDFPTAVALGEAQCYCLQVDRNEYLNLEGPGKLVNHSCMPNAGVFDDVFLFALETIGNGIEILYDYSTTMAEDFWTMQCRCGALVCRETIRDFIYLPDVTKARYLRRGMVQRFIREALQHPNPEQGSRLAMPSRG
ncbi:MAG: SET domain-containing protein-lysine N-methyltransferase [Polyangia bacterium]